MEKNNFTKAYIYLIAVFAIGIAVSNIISFFNGVGIALIGASVLLVLAITNILKDETIKKRFGDIFALIAIEFLMLIVLFFAYDFNLNGITNDFPFVMRNICAIYSMLALVYVIFRYISEIKGKKYNFVENMLGNGTASTDKKEKKAKLSKAEIKKNKELENGTLEPKPSSLSVSESVETQTPDVEVSEQTGESLEEIDEESNEILSEDEDVIIEEEDDLELEEETKVETSTQNDNQTSQNSNLDASQNYNNSNNNPNKTNYFWY